LLLDLNRAVRLFVMCLLAAQHRSAAASEDPKTIAAFEAVKAVVQSGGKAVRMVFAGGHSLVVKVDDAGDDLEKPVISAGKRTSAFVEDAFIDARYQVPAFVVVYRDGKMLAFKGPDGNVADDCFDGGVSLDGALRDQKSRL
jgi:hypothetical protein